MPPPRSFLAPAALLLAAFVGPRVAAAPDSSSPVDAATVARAKSALLSTHGEAHRPRIERGVDQVASLWRDSDGDLVEFVTAQFAADSADVDALFARFESQFEQIDGLFLELGRQTNWHADVDTGPMLPIDPLFAAFAPGAHLTEDLFTSRVAFVALLNYPVTTLGDRIRDGSRYTRRQWAEVRLTSRFDQRIPGEITSAQSAVAALADNYIANYNLWMHHVLAEDGSRLFPSGKRLISHWNLRDELKAAYAEPDGLARQRVIVEVMDRIVTQTIPAAAVDNPNLDWNPFTNALVAAPAATIEADAPPNRARSVPAGDADSLREPDTRFAHILSAFQAARRADPFAPNAPTALARTFGAAEMPEERVRSLITTILETPAVAGVAREIESRLGRKLGPQDIWYKFSGGGIPEAELDAETSKRYPTSQAFAADLPRILRDLGFPAEDADRIASHVEVDASRGAGHAMEARRRGDSPHLRTRVEPGGMNYKGYNIAIHEFGHNVEQYLSLYDVDHTLLAGVPNIAFTEALAFVFQARDLALLGRPSPGAEAERLRVLDQFWIAWEISGSALVEIVVWRWLYDHPDANAAELREATVRIARETWDRYYAPVLGGRGETALLGIYSHTVSGPLYLFHYVLGRLIAFQIEEHLQGKDAATFAAEFTRMVRHGAVVPDLWMQHATGAPVSAEPLLSATTRALGTSR